MIFIKNKYSTIYYNIVKIAKQRSTPIYPSARHHIIPESFFIKRVRSGPPGWLAGDSEDPENIVLLTLREHAVCHKLLVRMTEGKMKSKMVLAIWRMLNGKDKKLFSSREYEKYRTIFIEHIKITNSKKRKPLSKSHKQNISLATKGTAKSIEARKNMKDAWIDRDRTVKDSTKKLNKIASLKFWSSEEVRVEQSKKKKEFLAKNPKILENQIAYINKKIECGFCGIVTNLGNYKRWHGDRCMLNKTL